MHAIARAGLIILLGGLAACAKHQVEPTAMVPPAQGVDGSASMLAYEHEIDIVLAAEAIPARMAAVRDACQAGVHGSCSLIQYSERGGTLPGGSLQLRIAPSGVDSLAALASGDGQATRRQTRAEDLAQAVGDNARQRELLELNRARLIEFQSRPDLAVADMLAIARELAAIDAQLQARAQDAADQRRRLETNLLTLRFSSLAAEPSLAGRVGRAFGGSAGALLEGVEDAVYLIAYGLPFLLLLFVLALAWRAVWRRVTRPRP